MRVSGYTHADVRSRVATGKFGRAGTQRLYVQGAAASDFDDETLVVVGVGASHFFHDNHSVNLELNALAFD